MQAILQINEISFIFPFVHEYSCNQNEIDVGDLNISEEDTSAFQFSERNNEMIYVLTTINLVLSFVCFQFKLLIISNLQNKGEKSMIQADLQNNEISFIFQFVHDTLVTKIKLISVIVKNNNSTFQFTERNLHSTTASLVPSCVNRRLLCSVSCLPTQPPKKRGKNKKKI